MCCGGEDSGSGRVASGGLVGEVSGVNSNGVTVPLSSVSKLDRPDEGLVNGVCGDCDSGGNGM